MAAPVIFDGRAGRFRWPRRSFSMAAPVGFDGRAGRQLCPYEAQYDIDKVADHYGNNIMQEQTNIMI